MRPRQAAIAVAVPVTIAAGVAFATAPQRLAGPLNLNFALPLGAALLLVGVAGSEAMAAIGRRLPRISCVLAAAFAGGIAGWNFWHAPPIADGAYFLLRYGSSAGEWAPTSPAGMLLGAAACVWSVERAVRRVPVVPGLLPFAARLGGLIGWTVVACAGYGLFMDMLVRGPVRDALAGVPLACVPVALACHGLRGRFEGARSGLALSLATLSLSLASWALYRG